MMVVSGCSSEDFWLARSTCWDDTAHPTLLIQHCSSWEHQDLSRNRGDRNLKMIFCEKSLSFAVCAFTLCAVFIFGYIQGVVGNSGQWNTTPFQKMHLGKTLEGNLHMSLSASSLTV